MLTDIAIEQAALRGAAGDGSMSHRTNQQELLRLLRRHGRLVFSDSADLRRFLTLVEEFPQAVRSLWKIALPQIPLGHVDTTLSIDEIESAAQLAESWSGRASGAFVCLEKASVLGVPEDEPTFEEPVSGIELTLIDYPGTSARLQEAERLATEDVAAGTSRDAIWSERIAPVASTARVVTILDRYAGVDLLGRARPTQGDGVVWFLEQLNGLDVPPAVHLITQANSRSHTGTVAGRVRRIQGELGECRIPTMTVTLASNSSFRDAAHPRHLRFGHRSILLDRGLMMFEETACGQSTPCRGSCDPRFARERESLIEATAYCRRSIAW